MDTWFVILTVLTAGTLLLTYRRASAVEAKVQRVLREFQKLGTNLDEAQAALQGSVDELRREVYDKLTYKK